MSMAIFPRITRALKVQQYQEKSAKSGQQKSHTVTELTTLNRRMLMKMLVIIITVVIQIMSQKERGASQLIQILEWSTVVAVSKLQYLIQI